MSEPEDAAPLWIVGAGRAGLALGRLLLDGGAARALIFTGRRARAPADPLFTGARAAARYLPLDALRTAAPAGLVLAVPDDALPDLVTRLRELPVSGRPPVLHLSGARGADVLNPLDQLGCSVGALHPLAALPRASRDASRLKRIWWGVEADGEALRLAERIVSAAEGKVLRVRGGEKPLYHVAAVFASNYLVALLATAEQLMVRAGVPAQDARAALTGLAGGSVGDVAAAGPAAALTGPIARGDAQTVELHLAHLSGSEAALYSRLARATLELARAGGLDEAAAHRIAARLEEQD